MVIILKYLGRMPDSLGSSLDKNGIKGISKVVYRTDRKNADALKHLVQDEILEVIEGNDTKIEAVEYVKT